MRIAAIIPAVAILACMQFEPTAIPALAGGRIVMPTTYPHSLATASVAPDTEHEILQMTYLYLMDQVNSVTENEAFNRSQGTNQLAWDRVVDPLAEVLKQEAPKIQFARSFLRGTPAEHDWGQVELRNPKLTILGTTAILTATEFTELHYKHLKESYFYSIKHTFGFLLVNGEWKMDKDDLGDVADISPTPYARHTVVGVLHDDVSAVSQDLARPIDPQTVPEPGSLLHGIVVPPPADRFLVAAPTPRPDPYDGNAAADYATLWAANFNPDYPQYNDDCTNFASQALKAGGWTEDEEWHINAGASLLAATGSKGQTFFNFVGRAWTEARALWDYGTRQGEHRFAYWSSSAENQPHAPNETLYGVVNRGDLVFADWDSAGPMQHVMIVTTVSGSGRDWHRVQVSSHTAPERNKALPDIVVSAVMNDHKDPRKIRFYYAHPGS